MVTGEMGQVFVCKLEHTSTYDDQPPYSPNWEDYWEEGGYPVPPAWVNGQQYVVGDEVSYSDWESTSSYTCVRNHTASYDTNPQESGMYPGATVCWVRKNDWFVCVDDHESDLTKNCHNKLYWSELPFYNNGNFKKESPEKVIAVANSLNYLDSSWEVPNVFELALTINYGIMEGAKTEFPNAIADAYFTGTNVVNSEYGEFSYFYVNYANGNVGTTYSAYPMFKKKEA